MLMTRRRFAAFLAATLLAPSLIACGSDEPVDPSEEGQDGTDPAPGTVETQRPDEG